MHIMNEESRAVRLGVLGGTFDPPHYGHLLLADTARVQLRLQAVLFAPVGQPPHKPQSEPSPLAHRLAMCRAALDAAGEPAFRLSKVDVDRPGPHYTVDTLTILSRTYPSARIWFLIGGDSLADLAKWRAPERILDLACLGVLSRPGFNPDLEVVAREFLKNGVALTAQELERRIDRLMGPTLDISSTALRVRAAEGLPLRFLVPPSVEAYIRENGLYKQG